MNGACSLQSGIVPASITVPKGNIIHRATELELGICKVHLLIQFSNYDNYVALATRTIALYLNGRNCIVLEISPIIMLLGNSPKHFLCHLADITHKSVKQFFKFVPVR